MSQHTDKVVQRIPAVDSGDGVMDTPRDYMGREQDYTFFGISCSQVQFAVWMHQKTKGVCPFCARTGLTPRYGSDRKHIASCAKRRKQTVRPTVRSEAPEVESFDVEVQS